MFNNADRSTSSFGFGIGVGRGRGFGNSDVQPRNPGGWPSENPPAKINALNDADSGDFWDDTLAPPPPPPKASFQKENTSGWEEEGGSSNWGSADSSKTPRSQWGSNSGGNHQFGSNSNRGFGKNNYEAEDEVPKGGGMKSRGSGKGGPNSDYDGRGGTECHKCGEMGHISRNCPKGGDGDKKPSCYKCGELGHISRDCPKGGGGDRKSGCYKCGEDGHMAKDCTNPDKRTGPDGKPRPAPYVPPEPSEDENCLFEGVPTGINFDKYDSIPVTVSGREAPKPIQTFQDASFRNLLHTNIVKSQYTRPTPIQKYAIPIILKKRDLMACAQTGSGKTAAFLLPILQYMFEAPDLPNANFKELQEPWAVIISPTRELAIQIYNEARKFSHGSVVKVELIYGGTSVGYQSNRLKRGCHILVATPGRLLDFVEKGKISFRQVKYLILDEADRMLDMGFAPEVHRMVENPHMPPKGQRQTLMFSATFPERIQELAVEFLDNYLFLAVGVVGAANTDVQQSVFQVSQFDKRKKLMEIVSNSGQDRVLVFVELKRTADFIASFMSQSGLPTTSIHGDRMQREREEALGDFRTGRMPILVATAVAARGLDIKDVRHVINYDLPQSIDEYVHRIGRTGRVGNLGKATSFYDSDVDQPLARSLVKILQEANQVVPAWLLEEASNATGSTAYAGRGRFGARDVRSKDQREGGAGWRSDSYTENCGSNISTSEPVVLEDSWD